MVQSKITDHIEALKDVDIDMRQAALEALAKIGEPAVPALIEALKYGDVYNPQAAIPASAEPKESIIKQEVEKEAPSKTSLRVKDIFRKQPRDRSLRQHRTAIAPFSISGLKIDPVEARPGETITITFKVTNTVDVHSIYTVTLKVNGEVVAAEVVSLPRRASLPMNFTVVENRPGDYHVEVGDASGKFTILDKDPESKPVESEIFKSEIIDLETRIASGLVPVERLPEQKQSLGEGVTQSPGGLQSGIDKVADCIESGIDKMGNGIIFAIEKPVNMFTAIFKAVKRK